MIERSVAPLTQRPLDWILLVFFAVNLGFITYMFDLEQLVIADPAHFEYPLWPPRAVVDLVHWWASSFDPLLAARPPWYRATIWIDVLFFGPFYAAAIYAIVKGKEWIRIPAFFWSGMMFTVVTIILFEEAVGPHRTPALARVLSANLTWWLLPLFVTWRFARSEHPFTVPDGRTRSDSDPSNPRE